jgi:hypothetical protein
LAARGVSAIPNRRDNFTFGPVYFIAFLASFVFLYFALLFSLMSNLFLKAKMKERPYGRPGLPLVV